MLKSRLNEIDKSIYKILDENENIVNLFCGNFLNYYKEMNALLNKQNLKIKTRSNYLSEENKYLSEFLFTNNFCKDKFEIYKCGICKYYIKNIHFLNSSNMIFTEQGNLKSKNFSKEFKNIKKELAEDEPFSISHWCSCEDENQDRILRFFDANCIEIEVLNGKEGYVEINLELNEIYTYGILSWRMHCVTYFEKGIMIIYFRSGKKWYVKDDNGIKRCWFINRLKKIIEAPNALVFYERCDDNILPKL